jgi:hypothetical protein
MCGAAPAGAAPRCAVNTPSPPFPSPPSPMIARGPAPGIPAHHIGRPRGAGARAPGARKARPQDPPQSEKLSGAVTRGLIPARDPAPSRRAPPRQQQQPWPPHSAGAGRPQRARGAAGGANTGVRLPGWLADDPTLSRPARPGPASHGGPRPARNARSSSVHLEVQLPSRTGRPATPCPADADHAHPVRPHERRCGCLRRPSAQARADSRLAAEGAAAARHGGGRPPTPRG